MTLRAFLFSAFMMISLPCLANHVVVNCGPEGYQTKSSLTDENGYYVWLMNDSTVRIEKAFGGNWNQLGLVTYNPQSSDLSVADIPLANLKTGDTIQGENFQMEIGSEFSHPTRKVRRYFYAQFRAKNNDGSIVTGNIECVFGLK